MKIVIRFLLCVLTCSVAINASAQTDAQLKEINKLKLDPAYVFAESTMDSADEARETVCLTLSNFMNEYLEESGESRRVAAAELGAIKYITGKRGKANYVFGYIPVAAFASTAPAPLEAPVVAEAVPSQPVAKDVKEVDSDNGSLASDESSALGMAALSFLFGDIIADAFNSDVQYDSMECKPYAGDNSQLSDMIAELLETSDSRKAAYLLNIYKTTGKIRGYGALSTCRNAATAYWLIIGQDGRIESLLGPSSDDNRYNYITGATDHLANYGGKYAVWFTPRAM